MLKSEVISDFLPIFEVVTFDSRRFSLYFQSPGASPTIASASIKHRLVIDRERIQKLKLTWPTSLFFRSTFSRLSFRNIKKIVRRRRSPTCADDRLELFGFMMKFCCANDEFWRFDNFVNIHEISFN